MRAPAIMKGEREDSAAVIDVDNSVAGGVSIAGATSGQQLLKKGPWTAAEDAILMEYVKEHGEGNWNAVQKNSGLQRCGKSCRLRWANHLRPNLKKGSFSPEEEMLILQLHAEYGNKWARMAAHLPGRTDNEIKNYWNTRIKRRQRAGLPLYPPEIQQHLALRSQRQGQMDCFSRFKSSQSPLSLFNSGSPLFSQYSHRPVVLHNPNRAKNLSFQSANYASPVQFGLGNYDFDPPPVLLQSPPAYIAKMELPSSQFSSNSCNAHMPQGNSGLLDALLEESHRVGEVPNSKCPPPLDPIGIQVKQEVVTEAVKSANHDVSTLLDMIPMPTAMAAFSDWSNGPISEATADGEIGIQLPQLSSSQSMAQVELDWGIGSSWDSMQWANMPRIC